MSDPDVLDPVVIETLRQLTPPGEPDVLAEVLKLFMDEVPRRIHRVRQALDAGDATAVQRAAHSLKGSAGNIGAHRLYEISRQLDDTAKARDLAALAPLVGTLGAEYAKVEAEIQKMLG